MMTGATRWSGTTPHISRGRPTGMVLCGLGSAVTVWWVWRWESVDRLLTEHVNTYGPLPENPMQGTAAEVALCEYINALFGLSSGPAPLLVAAAAIVMGTVQLSQSQLLRGIAGSMVLGVVAIALGYLGPSMLTALEFIG